MSEIYRVIAANPDYMVSNMGNIARADSGTTLCTKMSKAGYLEIGLRRNKRTKWHLIHRLVAEAFCEKPTEKHVEVNHKDGDKANNRAENLEWVTHNQNLRHAYETGLREKDVSARPVIARDMKTGMTRMFSSIYEAAKTLNMSNGNICMCCQGKRPYANGYFWRYKEGMEENT